MKLKNGYSSYCRDCIKIKNSTNYQAKKDKKEFDVKEEVDSKYLNKITEINNIIYSLDADELDELKNYVENKY